MQDKQITNPNDFSEIIALGAVGRILALDLGTKKIGVAVCDEFRVTVRPVSVIKRTSWKELLKSVRCLIEEFDAVALVLGLPLNFDGSENDMSLEARRLSRNFALSLSLPVFLQDERLTTKDAQQELHDRGYEFKEILKRLDGEAAALILQDFLAFKTELDQRRTDR